MISAAALPAQDEEVASPCINVCRISEENGYCEGCRRSLDEIASWAIYTAAEKRSVIALLSARRTIP